jgi:hypothetical protein
MNSLCELCQLSHSKKSRSLTRRPPLVLTPRPRNPLRLVLDYVARLRGMVVEPTYIGFIGSSLSIAT